MPRFTYKVRDGHGALATGLVQAATLEEAGLLLRGEGKYVIHLAAASEAETRSDSQDTVDGLPSGRIRRHEVITFANQMAVMLDTGVPISEALQCIADQSQNPAFKGVIADIAQRVQAGGELSEALAAYPKVFPSIMTSLVRASEASGTMGTMLDRIAVYMQKEHATVKKIRGALAYPCFMLLMVVLVVVFLLVYVLPQFTGIYAQRGAALPAPTRLLMAMSEAVTAYSYYWLGGVATAVATLVFAVRTRSGRRTLDMLKLKTPVVGPLFKKLYITRGCRTMGTMIAAGVPILDMIAIVRQVTQNAWYQDLWDDVDNRLRKGAQLSDALFEAPMLIPRSVAQMIYSGEKSGRLSQVMDRVAAYTEQEFDEQVKTSTQFIEPALVSAMGIIIGFVAIALLLPIFSMGKVMAAG